MRVTYAYFRRAKAHVLLLLLLLLLLLRNKKEKKIEITRETHDKCNASIQVQFKIYACTWFF